MSFWVFVRNMPSNKPNNKVFLWCDVRSEYGEKLAESMYAGVWIWGVASALKHPGLEDWTKRVKGSWRWALVLVFVVLSYLSILIVLYYDLIWEEACVIANKTLREEKLCGIWRGERGASETLVIG